MRRPLTQQEIDAAFGIVDGERPSPKAEPFDIRKLDKVPKSQLQSLHLIHETFARSLASSLSAYLRSYVTLNIVSLEQISYGEFVDQLSTPACLAYIGLQPYEGSAVLDLNTGLAFRFIELLLGSKDQSSAPLLRKITDIEKKLLQTVLRIAMHDLHDAWRTVAKVNFSIQSLSSEPQLLYAISPAEAMLVIAVEIRLGTASGLMNLAMPYLFIKRLRNSFDQLQKTRRIEATEANQLHLGQLLHDVKLNFDIQLTGEELHARSVLDLKVGDVLALDHPSGAPLTGLLNGTQVWLGNPVEVDGQLGFEISRHL